MTATRGLVLLGLAFFTSTEAHAIMGGEEDHTHDAVVGIGATLDGITYIRCSGTLIAPRLVLAAAHCDTEITFDFVEAVGGVYFGPDAEDPEAVVGVDEVLLHPDYFVTRTGDLHDEGTASNDVGLLVLSEAVDVRPSLLRTDAVTTEHLGQDLLAVGYGKTVHNIEDWGRRRATKLYIDDFLGEHIFSDDETNPTGGNMCWGDVGAPLFGLTEDGTEVQWAIASWTDAHCYRETQSTPVEVGASWILEQVEDLYGSSDLCEVNGFYGDGACDSACGEPDPDCADADPDGHGHEDGDEAGESPGCHTAPARGWAVALLGLAGVLRRRRG